MRTTLVLDDDLVAEAQRLIGTTEMTALIGRPSEHSSIARASAAWPGWAAASRSWSRRHGAETRDRRRPAPRGRAPDDRCAGCRRTTGGSPEVASEGEHVA